MTLLREKERHEFVVPARPQPELLLACKQPLPKPAYLVVGGLVFVPLMSVYESLIPRRKLDAVRESLKRCAAGEGGGEKAEL